MSSGPLEHTCEITRELSSYTKQRHNVPTVKIIADEDEAEEEYVPTVPDLVTAEQDHVHQTDYEIKKKTLLKLMFEGEVCKCFSSVADACHMLFQTENLNS